MTAIETERLLLRMPRPEDLEALLPMHADPEVMRWIGGVRDRAETEAAVARWLELWDANGIGHFVAERRADGVVLGRVGFVVWDTRTWEIGTREGAGTAAQPELGWAIAREHWGNGFATEGARAARDWFLAGHGDERLVSVIAPENVRSRRVAEKLGCVPGETFELAAHGHAVLWEHPR